MYRLTQALWGKLVFFVWLDVYSHRAENRRIGPGKEQRENRNEYKNSKLIQRKGAIPGRYWISWKVCLELSCMPSRGNLQDSRICWEGMQQRDGEIQELYWVSNLFIPMSEKWLGNQPPLIIEFSGYVQILRSETHSLLPHLHRIYITWDQRSWGVTL